jgi:hypothetical protein
MLKIAALILTSNRHRSPSKKTLEGIASRS